MDWFRKATEQGHAAAQYHLGKCYYYGWGVEKDEAEAVDWYRKAAEQDNDYAQFALGKCYEEGFGVEQDKVEAVKWYRKAAEQNNDDAVYAKDLAYVLGKYYEDGCGVTKSWRLAIKQYLKAAELERRIKVDWGDIVFGSVLDFSAPATRCLHAAEQGNVDAQFALGCLYKAGVGVELDIKKAMEWYRQAARQGDVEAQHVLEDYSGDELDKSEMVTTDSQKDVKVQCAIGDHGEYYYDYNGGELDIKKALECSFTIKSKIEN